MSTTVPLAAFSATALAAALVSVTVPTFEFIDVVQIDGEDS